MNLWLMIFEALRLTKAKIGKVDSDPTFSRKICRLFSPKYNFLWSYEMRCLY